MVPIVPLALISLQLMGRVVTMGTTMRSSVCKAFTRSRRVGVRDGVCAWVVEFVGSLRRVVVGLLHCSYHEKCV